MKTGLTKDQISSVQEAMRESGQATDERPTRSLKSHEETWTTGEGALSGALYSGDTWIGSFTNAERARLAVHAPKMAAMLLDLLKNYECGEMVDAQISAILKAAVVIE